MPRTHATIKPSCKCNFPFCESSLLRDDHKAIYEVSIFTKQGIMIFTNRALTDTGGLEEADDLDLRCVRCGTVAEWN